ncbi:hypothetical protein KEM55_005867 [Ascosphaera atra]|nr:hypothetical protein KEM55_005867 [Ascosphaera atra]
MRYSYIFSVLAATAALAGKVDNAINIPRDGYNIEAGKDTTLTWNPSTDGTVTIKLQDMTNNDVVTPNDGIVLARE